ncbi:CHAT domain-containing protein [Streptomyces sp. NPDC053367]|uniref:CHAT domain-containing protein n=1 Tax=Streptomyces sp. NPDC053367 TaxID=3365700 RepID=UPI0037D72469
MREERLAAVRALLRRISETGDPALALEPSALAVAEQLAAQRRDDPGDLEVCHALGWLHWYQFQKLPEDRCQPALDAAVQAFTPCFLTGVDGLPQLLLPLLAEAAAPYALGLLNQALASTDPALFTSGVDLWQDIVRAAPADDPRRAGYLSNLSLALQLRFGRTGDGADLDAAITIGRDAVQAAPADHPNRALSVSGLGNALWDRFRRTGSQADLDEAIDCYRDALRSTPSDGPNRPIYLFYLGRALRDRFEHTGSRSDLEEAITIGRDAVQATPADDPGRPAMLSGLAVALATRFEHTGDRTDQDEAIDHIRAAVHTTPADHPDRAGRLSNLGGALERRFERVGDRGDLDEAVDRHHEAVRATPADHPVRPAMLSNLGNALQLRFQRFGDGADLDEAVSIGREAVQATPADHPGRPVYLTTLGLALQDQFRRIGNPADLDEAIDRHREAVRATPADHPNGPATQSNLATALQLRFLHTEERKDLDEAIDRHREAVRATPADHPARTRRLSNLGNALRFRFQRSGDQADRDEAVSAYEGAWGVASGAPSSRIRAAWAAAGLLARSEAGRAADLAEAAVRLLPQVAVRQLERGDQQHALGSFAGLAGDAAALALADPRGTRQERAARALRLLEAGRAVLLSQALDTRSDLTDLSRQHPGLAARFVRLRDQLDQPAATSPPPAGGDEDVDVLRRRQARLGRDRHELARDFTQTMADIRSLAGFHSFALPPTDQELLSEAGQGPIVVFNISPYRSDALLLTADGITQVELPHLTAETLAEKAGSFHQALRTAASGASREQRREAQAELTGVLEWLWDAAAGPVLAELGHHRRPPEDADWPRVWWAPGGLLGLLPLHAAGYHAGDPAGSPHRRTVMDRVVSSYTPTVRALRHARTHPPACDPPAPGLVVAMPTTPGLPGQGRLPHVRSEVATLHRHFPELVLLSEPDPHDGGTAALAADTPTKANVLERLPSCSIVHFACHGTSDPADPSRSRLLLHDHAGDPLTVASLAPVRLDRAQLAYLSACRTAAVDAAELADEAIHLTSAFQLAGFPHVVGTLWEIDDQTAVTVADAFYTHLRTSAGTIDTGRAALALHQAVRGLRDGHDLPGQYDRTQVPFLWAAYLHAGT